jgi:hypothetical protein
MPTTTTNSQQRPPEFGVVWLQPFFSIFPFFRIRNADFNGTLLSGIAV